MDFFRAYQPSYQSPYQQEKPKFAFVHINEIAHEFLNEIGAADENFQNFFQNFFPILGENSLVVVLSDHGHRMDSKFRMTLTGKNEDLLPLLIVIPPKNFSPKKLENFKKNSDRLVTVFDLHATFRQILSEENEQNDFYHNGMYRDQLRVESSDW